MTEPDGCLPVGAPLSVDDAETFAWTATCDALVVGFGAAGAAAAIAARQAGAQVLVVERFEGGGATARSGGVVYAGGGTAHQKKAGYDDTPDQMFRYLRQETGDAVSEATLRRFCEDSPRLLQWLESMGANFESSAPPPKTSYPKDGVYLYYSGNEAVPDRATHATPAPRGHRTRGSWLSGRALFGCLRGKVEALGAAVLTQSAARRLIVDRRGTVVGAEIFQLPPDSPAAQRHRKLIRWAEVLHNFSGKWADRLRARALALELAEARPLRVRALRGVILTTGGFIFNRKLVTLHAPKFLPAMRLGATGCDGSGILLGQSAGGAVARLDKVSAWRFINPPTAWPRGIALNRWGQRFCNEQVYGATLGVEMCEHADGHAWLVLDRNQRKAAMREALTGGLWFFQSVPAFLLMLGAPRAHTLADLARKIGWPTHAVRETVDRYNQAARGEVPDELGKAPDMIAPLDTPPYYALDISADNRRFPCPAITLGGLRVDEASGGVLNGAGVAIAGLYAAGRAAVGIASNGYVSGLSIADCLWSGIRAGASVAQRPESAVERKIA